MTLRSGLAGEILVENFRPAPAADQLRFLKNILAPPCLEEPDGSSPFSFLWNSMTRRFVPNLLDFMVLMNHSSRRDPDAGGPRIYLLFHLHKLSVNGNPTSISSK